MSVSVVKICSHCRRLTIGGTECPNCKLPFQQGDVGLPVPAPVRLQGQAPAPGQVAALQNEPHRRRAPSAEETKKAVRLLVVGLVIGPLMTLFGLWVIANFRGFGVLFFGYLPTLAGPLLLISLVVMGIHQLLRDGRKKTPEKAFTWVWKESYFAAADFSFGSYARYEKPDYAYGSLMRALPQNMRDTLDKDTVLRYLGQLRSYVDGTLDAASANLDLTCNGKTGQPFTNPFGGESMDISCEIDEVTPLGEGVCQVTGRLKLCKNLTCKVGENDTYHLPASAVHITVSSVYVQNGNYWFPCDVMPLFAEEEMLEPVPAASALPPMPQPTLQTAPPVGAAQTDGPMSPGLSGPSASPPGAAVDGPF